MQACRWAIKCRGHIVRRVHYTIHHAQCTLMHWTGYVQSIYPDAADVPGGIFNAIYLENLNSAIIFAGNWKLPIENLTTHRKRTDSNVGGRRCAHKQSPLNWVIGERHSCQFDWISIKSENQWLLAFKIYGARTHGLRHSSSKSILWIQSCRHRSRFRSKSNTVIGEIKWTNWVNANESTVRSTFTDSIPFYIKCTSVSCHCCGCHASLGICFVLHNCFIQMTGALSSSRVLYVILEILCANRGRRQTSWFRQYWCNVSVQNVHFRALNWQ